MLGSSRRGDGQKTFRHVLDTLDCSSYHSLIVGRGIRIISASKYQSARLISPQSIIGCLRHLSTNKSFSIRSRRNQSIRPPLAFHLHRHLRPSLSREQAAWTTLRITITHCNTMSLIMDSTLPPDDVVDSLLKRTILPYLRSHRPENADPVVQTEEATLSVCTWFINPT